MAVQLWRTDEADFRERFAGLLRKLSLDEGLTAPGSGAEEAPAQAVRRIVADVRERGDAALLEYVERFDGCRLTAGELRVPAEQIKQAVGRCPAELLGALRLAAERVRRFQQSILLRDPEPLREPGRTLATHYAPMDSAGVHIPGASASLASSVIMTAVPARVAGVARVVMATPPRPDGTVSDDRLAAADVAGVDEVYRMGGPCAIAALAYGTESVPPVDFVVGPANIYGVLAKKEVFGQVGIEMLAGPSEVVIIADATADPECVAADMLAQAEHNPASAVLLTEEQSLAERVGRALEARLADLPGAEATRACLAEYGALIVCRSMDECVELTNELAPEHLEIITEHPDRAAAGIRHAAAVFLGAWTPVALGDYVAGPSHTLPTGRTARFSSGLSANDFLKRTSIVRYDRDALAGDAGTLARLARSEGLEGHARSVEVRIEAQPDG